jgi:hypothetical protein
MITGNGQTVSCLTVLVIFLFGAFELGEVASSFTPTSFAVELVYSADVSGRNVLISLVFNLDELTFPFDELLTAVGALPCVFASWNEHTFSSVAFFAFRTLIESRHIDDPPKKTIYLL